MLAVLLWFAAATQPVETVALPSYQAVPDISRYASRDEYQRAASDERFTLEKVGYPSDGLDIHAYVYGPRATDKKLPVIVFNRGSWTWPEGFAGEFLVTANRLAQSGYLVVAPIYRGSGGDPGVDELGGADLNDLFNLLPVIRAMPNADVGRLYLYGESRGGMMVYQALRDGFPARAAAVVGAFTDLEGMLANPQMAKFGDQIWPDLSQKRVAIVERRSALRWAEKLDRPLLILHGGDDVQVPVSQSLGLAAKLAAADKPFELHVVEGGRHTLSDRGADRDRWVADWFARH